MRTFLILVLVVGRWAPIWGQSDRENIMAIIAQETEAYMNVDYKTWASAWHHVPYAFWAYSDLETARELDGWDAMNKSFTQYFKTSKPSQGEIMNDWIEIRIYENGAYVRFTQKVKDDFDTQVTAQIRVLEKVEGKWKIVCMKAVAVGD